MVIIPSAESLCERDVWKSLTLDTTSKYYCVLPDFDCIFLGIP